MNMAEENEMRTAWDKVKFYSHLIARAAMAPTMTITLLKGVLKASFNGGNLDQAARDMEQSGEIDRAQPGIARDAARLDRIEGFIDAVKKKLHLKP
jgi:hypothetical protein